MHFSAKHTHTHNIESSFLLSTGRQLFVNTHTHLNGRKHTFKTESFICFKCSTVSVCDWQVVADTNISAIANQVESLSSSSTPSTNPEVRPVEPEWVTSPWQQDCLIVLFDLKHSVTGVSGDRVWFCCVWYWQDAQATDHHSGEGLRGAGLQHRGRLWESTWRSSYLRQNRVQQGNSCRIIFAD